MKPGNASAVHIAGRLAGGLRDARTREHLHPSALIGHEVTR